MPGGPDRVRVWRDPGDEMRIPTPIFAFIGAVDLFLVYRSGGSWGFAVSAAAMAFFIGERLGSGR